MTHERVLVVRPVVLDPWDGTAPAGTRETEVSLSVADRVEGGGWVLGVPTVQVEGGSYGPVAARQLRDALDEVLALVGGVIGP